MERRAKGVYVPRTPSRSAYVVMVCQDRDETEMVSRLLTNVGPCVLATYHSVEDLASNPPGGVVSLVIVAGDLADERMELSLRWLKRWRSSAAVAVVTDTGRPSLEMVVRAAGASYFVRPVAETQWRALLEHALSRTAGPTVVRK